MRRSTSPGLGGARDVRAEWPRELHAAAEELGSRWGGVVASRSRRAGGWCLWAPFGFVPVLVEERGAYGFFAHEGTQRDVADWPVAWWDFGRGQLAPVASSLAAAVRMSRLLRDPCRTRVRRDLEAALLLDPGAAGPALALGELHLDAGEHAMAMSFLRRSARLAPWWMAPAILLFGLYRLRGGRGEAARWAREAVSRRWDATGAGPAGFVPRLGDDPRAVLRGLVRTMASLDGMVRGMRFDPAWRAIRGAEDPLGIVPHLEAARQLDLTDRTAEAAARCEWLVLFHGAVPAAERAERLYEGLGWDVHRDNVRLLRSSMVR